MRKTYKTAVQPASRSPLLWIALLFVLMCGVAPSTACCQAIPAAEAAPISTGFELPHVQGSMQYSVSTFETVASGYYGNSGLDSATGLSGNLAYISNSTLYPFSLVFSGGDSWSTSGQPPTPFLNLALSQVLNTRNWNFVLSNSVNYLPQTPSTGISGIPGTGDLGVPPVQIGNPIGQGLLTLFATRVTNVASASAERKLTGKTSLDFGGSYSILRFVGNAGINGIDTTGESGNVGLTHRIDARTTFSGNYGYVRNLFGENQPGFISQTANLQYTRQLSRKVNLSVSAGPQWDSSTNTSQNSDTAQVIPTTVNFYANSVLGYTGEFAHMSLTYSRGTNSGFGVVQGARSDSVSFLASRNFARVWSGSLTTAFTHTTGLAPNQINTSFSPETVIAATQLSRAIARSISVYASYTLEDQSTVGSTTTNAFSGFFQLASFGITYSPALIHFGPR